MYKLEGMSDQDKIDLTFSLMNVMQNWELSDRVQAQLLALPEQFKVRSLYLYRQGDKTLDYTQPMLTRAKALMGIYESLGTTYPANRNYGTIWLKRPMKKFDKKTPLEIMLEGDVGIKRIWHFLDCTQSWN